MQKNITTSSALPLGSLLLVSAIAAVWGFNFIMVKIGLEQTPPLTLCALRFLFASIPAIFFLPKPELPWKYILIYGLTTLALPFSCIFIGMSVGVTPGIAALIVQLQVFFAIFFAYLFANQSVSPRQIIGALVSFSGVGIIALHRDGSMTGLGFMIILSGAISWAIGNVIGSKFKSVNILSLVSWGSFIAFFPLISLAFYFEDPLPILMHPQQLSWTSIVALAYITYASTHFGYGGWAWLLNKYPIASITPFSLLAPIIALVCSSLMLHEPFESWKIASAILVISGLGLNVFGQKLSDWATNLKLRLRQQFVQSQ